MKSKIELKNITVTIEEIGPKEAAEILSKNLACQRHIRPSHIKYIAREMSENRWVTNGDTIVFSDSDKLINGQNRMTAVVKSGTTQQFIVVRGIPESAFHTIDRNAVRTHADLNQIAGKNIPGYRSSVCGVLWKHERAASRDGSINMFDRPDYEDLDEIDKKNSNAIEISHQFTSAANKTLGLPPSITGACFVLIANKRGIADAQEFVTRLINGDMLAVGNPILVLRNTLVADQVATAKLPPFIKMAMVIKGFNLWKSGKTGVRLKITYSLGGMENGKFVKGESFPQIQ